MGSTFAACGMLDAAKRTAIPTAIMYVPVHIAMHVAIRVVLHVVHAALCLHV